MHISKENNAVLPTRLGILINEPNTEITCKTTHENTTYEMMPLCTLRRLSSFQNLIIDFNGL